MIEFSNPEWLKERLGNVGDIIGSKGTIELHSKNGNKVIICLTREDGSFAFVPTSVALSEMIESKMIVIDELRDHEVMELSSGYICISQLEKGIKVDDVTPLDSKDIFKLDW
jgi:hypothetical protein